MAGSVGSVTINGEKRAMEEYIALGTRSLLHNFLQTHLWAKPRVSTMWSKLG